MARTPNRIPWLDSESPYFPPLSEALTEPNGLLAAGGDLSVPRLLLAYRSGIFPWYEEGQPILWWSPDPRMVLFPNEIRISRSLGKRLRGGTFDVTLNARFDEVVEHCSKPRDYGGGTWITDAMKSAYSTLHHIGYAHSIETWFEGQLVGGLYGVGIGKLFFGESMFHTKTDASKVALAWLARLMIDHDGPLIDCQMENPHLLSLGARGIPRAEFEVFLKRDGETTDSPIRWQDLPSNLGPW